MNILKKCFKIYIKTRKGENLDQEIYEKKCNEFYDNFDKFIEKRRMMSEYTEVK